MTKPSFEKALDYPVFKIIRQAVNDLNVEAYIIGGFVRDLIMQRKCNDIDIVVVGSGIDLAKKVAELIGINTKVSVFKTFGTAMVNYNAEEKWEIEFVGARKESYQRNSRKPIVENGSLEDDQNRRDFTINALAIDLRKDNLGKLLDPFNGLLDIKNKIVKTPLNPDITYSDDPLRMMRAIRFASQLGFDISCESFEAIKKNAERIEIVSQERITDELNKIILSQKPSHGFKLLLDSGLLKIIFPKMIDLLGVEEINGISHKDNFYHTTEVLDNIAEISDDLWLRWVAILHDIGKPSTKKFVKGIGWTFHAHDYFGSKMIQKIFKEFKLPLNEKMKYVQKMVLLHLRPIALIEHTITDSAIRRLLFDAGEDIDDLMEICKADITSKNQKKVRKYLKNFELVKEKLIEIEEKDKIRNWQPPISGNDIISFFGIEPGREVGIIKNAIREAILEGEIKNEYEEAYEFMLEEGEKLGLNPVKK